MKNPPGFLELLNQVLRPLRGPSFYLPIYLFLLLPYVGMFFPRFACYWRCQSRRGIAQVFRVFFS